MPTHQTWSLAIICFSQTEKKRTAWKPLLVWWCCPSSSYGVIMRWGFVPFREIWQYLHETLFTYQYKASSDRVHSALATRTITLVNVFLKLHLFEYCRWLIHVPSITWKVSEVFHETLCSCKAASSYLQSGRTIDLVYIVLELHSFEICK